MAAPCHRVIFLACGSFNPPTIMHLRLFELARDFYRRELPSCTVLGGVISPTHDTYNKKGLLHSTHRLAMAKLAVEDRSWINVSDWEVRQENWTRTRAVLDAYSQLVNQESPPDWLSNRGSEEQGPIKIKLLCGGDLLESFSVPGLWLDEDIRKIVTSYGLLVVSREGSNPAQFIDSTEVLRENRENIHIINEWVNNDVSSTKIRNAVQSNRSIKYLVPDPVIDYIYKQKLYL